MKCVNLSMMYLRLNRLLTRPKFIAQVGGGEPCATHRHCIDANWADFGLQMTDRPAVKKRRTLSRAGRAEMDTNVIRFAIRAFLLL